MSLGTRYLETVISKFEEVKTLGDKTMNQLDEESLLWSRNEASNSIAAIIKHLNGNMISRWTDFLKTDGEKEYRNRDAEFLGDIESKDELFKLWEEGWRTLFRALSSLNEDDLLKTIYIRSEGQSVLEAIERQMSHYSYHVGQIVYIGKDIKGEDFKSLSIPKGSSEEYLKDMKNKNRAD